MASELEKYETVCPGAADRIIKMAEEQSKHRQELEKIMIKSGTQNDQYGIHYSFFLTILLMLAGFVLLWYNKETAAYTSIFGPVIFHGANYIYRRYQQDKQGTSKEG